MDKAKVPAGAVVVDPYMGSGSTIIAAIRTGRKAIGFEQDPEHFANAVQRITNELAQGDLFLGHNNAMSHERSELARDMENGAPERIRTSDPQIRSLVLYPAELRAPLAFRRRRRL